MKGLMYMHMHYISKLEFNKVLENLSMYCSTNLGKELAMNLQIYNTADMVKQKLTETDVAVKNIFKIIFNKLLSKSYFIFFYFI